MAKELNVQIGYRIKIARESACLTQEAFAGSIDVSVQYISDLERGKVGASTQTIIKICNALNVTSDYILMGKKSTSSLPEDLIRLESLTPDQMKLITKQINLTIDAFSCSTACKPD